MTDKRRFVGFSGKSGSRFMISWDDFMKVVRESVFVFTRECTVRENLNKNERPIQGVTRLFGQVIRRWINTPSRSRQNDTAATETIDSSLFTRWLRRRAPKLQPAFAHRPLQSIRLEERR
ncbi:MAG TPA: hypothetical protein DD473_23280, partial [Planctomycetaceae bacterium]|nr:hypothetical protein [Planctomycetaceae bacterium]